MKIATKKEQNPRICGGVQSATEGAGVMQASAQSLQLSTGQEGHTDKKLANREERKLAVFIRELAIVKAQCDAGMDPAVSIAATCFISKRSHATVYRDIKKGFLPSPMKIGRRSVLSFSVVKAYAAGKLIGGAA